jgi:hypothetical protein
VPTEPPPDPLAELLRNLARTQDPGVRKWAEALLAGEAAGQLPPRNEKDRGVQPRRPARKPNGRYTNGKYSTSPPQRQ